MNNASICLAADSWLNAVRLINEPTAAAMAYGLHTQQKIPVRWCLISVAARLTSRCSNTLYAGDYVRACWR